VTEEGATNANEPSEGQDIKDKRSYILSCVKEADVKFCRLQFTDILGIPKNIVIPASRLEEALDDGVPFDASSIVGYATIEESDKIAIPDPSSFAILPPDLVKLKTARFTCDIYEPNGERFIGDPKFALERVMAKAKDMGFTCYTGPECEFFIFKMEDGKPTNSPNDFGGYFDLSPLDLSDNIRGEISTTLQELGFQIFTSHHEVSSGQHEINFHYGNPLTTADRVVTLRYVAKAIALKNDLHASFMPKPIYGMCGSGMHTHMSLFRNGDNAFFDPDSEGGLSQSCLHYIGGVLSHTKEINAILNSWVNSYKRLVPGFEAPTYISWAHANRSALIRIPAKRGEGTRFELRNPDPAGNPYLQFAVIIAAGLDGIERGIEPPAPVEKDIYTMSHKEREEHGIGSLAGNLGHALTFMEESEFMKETLGPHIFKHFLYIKKKEWAEYRTQVTEWELEKFLPIL